MICPYNGFSSLHHHYFDSYRENNSSKKMKEKIIFKGDSKNVKKPLHLKDCVFLLYMPRNIRISPMQYKRHDTDVGVMLKKNSHGFFTSKFRED